MIEPALLLAIGGLMYAVGGIAPHGAAGTTELAFGYLLLAAFLGARILSRFGLPKLTGYLIVGACSGPFLLRLVTVEMTDSLVVVSDIAAALLGLIAGSRLDLKRVRPAMTTLRSIVALGSVTAMFVLSALLFALRRTLPMCHELSVEQCLVVCVLVGVALSAQSPAVVTAMLSETRADGPLSRAVLASVVLSDLVVVVAYSGVAAVAGLVFGAHVGVGTALAVSWSLIGSLGFGVILGTLIALASRYARNSAPKFALLACVVVAAISRLIHVDPLIAMMAAGLYLANFSRSRAFGLSRTLESAEPPVFLVFFAVAGVRLDLDQLWATVVPVIAIATTRAAVLFIGCRAACVRTQADAVLANHAWTGLVPQAGLSLAFVVALQRDFPSFGPPAAALMLSVIAVNQMIAPILLRVSLVRSEEIGKRRDKDSAELVRT